MTFNSTQSDAFIDSATVEQLRELFAMINPDVQRQELFGYLSESEERDLLRTAVKLNINSNDPVWTLCLMAGIFSKWTDKIPQALKSEFQGLNTQFHNVCTYYLENQNDTLRDTIHSELSDLTHQLKECMETVQEQSQILVRSAEDALNAVNKSASETANASAMAVLQQFHQTSSSRLVEASEAYRRASVDAMQDITEATQDIVGHSRSSFDALCRDFGKRMPKEAERLIQNWAEEHKPRQKSDALRVLVFIGGLLVSLVLVQISAYQYGYTKGVSQAHMERGRK